jgi:hypothetical protein
LTPQHPLTVANAIEPKRKIQMSFFDNVRNAKLQEPKPNLAKIKKQRSKKEKPENSLVTYNGNSAHTHRLTNLISKN